MLPSGVRFRVRLPAAASVSVAGDFSRWSHAAHPTTRAGDYWAAAIPLPAGEDLFMYLVDGPKFATPPNAARVGP